MNGVGEFLTTRARVLDTGASILRVVGWTVVWLTVISRLISSSAPRYTDRATVADVPASDVRYVAPLSRTDLAGFLPPDHDPRSFTVAWIGGSEIKLYEVSVPGEFSRRVSDVGGRPLLIDAYNLVAPRALDVYIALRAAIASGADAVVVAVNPVWFLPQWSIHDWPNLDVSDVTALARRTQTWPWFAASVSPSDGVWATLRASLPLIRSRSKANRRLQDALDHLNVLSRPTPPVPAKPVPKPFQSSKIDFWLAQFLGTDSPTDSVVRLGLLLKGMGIDDRAVGDEYVQLLLVTAASSGRPAYFYSSALSFEAINDPSFEPLAQDVESRLAASAAPIDSPNLVVQSRLLTREMAPGDLFRDVIHMKNASRFADLLVEKLCGTWRSLDPGLTCTRTGAVGEKS